MSDLFNPIKNESLKDVFIARFEHLILSGKLKIGQRLPSERDLAQQMGVSRPVVHEGLVELAHKGLVRMKPRVGTLINDYRSNGSLALLSSLLTYRNGDLDPTLLASLLEMRVLFEVETTRLAALNRSSEHVTELQRIVSEEKSSQERSGENLVSLDFSFHHCIAMASGNVIYPLLLNSFREMYTHMTAMFFSDQALWPFVISHHEQLVTSIESGDEAMASEVMKRLLEHGARHLEMFLSKKEEGQHE